MVSGSYLRKMMLLGRLPPVAGLQGIETQGGRTPFTGTKPVVAGTATPSMPEPEADSGPVSPRFSTDGRTIAIPNALLDVSQAGIWLYIPTLAPRVGWKKVLTYYDLKSRLDEAGFRTSYDEARGYWTRVGMAQQGTDGRRHGEA
nr:hypothetical protein [Barnaviridae sp.]